MKARIERFVFGGVAAVRPWLLVRGLLLLIAFDSAVDLVPHGGRYGTGGFNVAQLPWLDAIQPVPSPTLYLGVLFACALIALTQAFAGPTKLGMAALTALYTYSWSMSMLDSYQHHYLLSLLLASAIFFPTHTLASLLVSDEPVAPPIVVHPEKHKKRKRRRGKREHGVRSYTPPSGSTALAPASRKPKLTSAFGYVSFGLTCTIVYAYTALTKLEPGFRNGDALGRMMPPPLLDRVRDLLGDPSMSTGTLLRLLAWGAIALQLVTAIGIPIALGQDRRTRGTLAVAALGLAPFAFHMGASALPIRIGWFASYMLLVHFVIFAPARLLLAIARTLDVFRVWLRERLPDAPVGVSTFEGILFAVLALAVVPVFYGMDLPGAVEAAVFVGLSAVVVGIRRSIAGNGLASRSLSVSLVAAAIVLRIAVSHEGVRGPSGSMLVAPSDVRHWYYRYVAGDAARMGDVVQARAAYRKAHAFAPDGATRALMTQRLRALEEAEATVR